MQTIQGNKFATLTIHEISLSQILRCHNTYTKRTLLRKATLIHPICTVYPSSTKSIIFMTPFVRYVGGCLSRCSCVTIIRNSGSTTRISLYCRNPSGTSEQFNKLNKDSFPKLFGTTHLSSLLHITKHLPLL